MKIYVSYDIFPVSATSANGNIPNDDDNLRGNETQRNHFNAAWGYDEKFMVIIFDMNNNDNDQ